MSTTEIKLAILMENLNKRCMYYPQDRYGCKKLPNSSKYCNCGGDIQSCDLTYQELLEEQLKRSDK